MNIALQCLFDNSGVFAASRPERDCDLTLKRKLQQVERRSTKKFNEKEGILVVGIWIPSNDRDKECWKAFVRELMQ